MPLFDRYLKILERAIRLALLFTFTLFVAEATAQPAPASTGPCSADGTGCGGIKTAGGITLTSGRVPYATTGGALADDPSLTYDAATDTLSAGALTATSGGSAGLGAELLTNASFDADLSSWTPGANWAWAAGGAQHTAGSTATLAQSVSVTSGSSYQVAFTISGRTAGTIAVSLGAVALNAGGTTTWPATNAGTGIVAGASGSVALTITPTTDFDGTLDSVSIKLITASSPAITVADGGVTAIAVRGSAALDNTFVGDMTGRLNTTGTSNSGMGVDALYANTSGGNNSAMGANALRSNTTGSNNSAMGLNALRTNTTGGSNSAMGLDALRSNTTGSNNSAMGANALRTNTTGTSNSGMGVNALRTNTTGTSNSAMGVDALYANTSGGGNSAMGANALYGNTGGSNNMACGKDAGYTSGAAPTATNAVTTGSNLTFVGYQSGLGSATQRSNSTAIGSGAYVDADNTVVLGNGSVTDVLMGSTAGAYANAAGLKSPTATHQLGGANSATPVAQTLQAQGSRGGTDTNVAGANLTIRPGAGTGSAAGSTVTIQTPAVGSSGTTAQTQTNRLVASAKGIAIPGLAEYADNAAALAGGLVAGDLYRTSTGVLMVTY